MDYKKPRGPQPESIGARKLITLMVSKGWLCDKIGGGKYTAGWPDYWCYHRAHGFRWVETKAPGGRLRGSQLKRFSRWKKKGIKVFICEDDTDYEKLFKDYDNWELYI